ncbi:hypothetical protein DV532_25850 (plasmid) [Pseudomonas sp. Leaf58]|uniref:hypothetical protein n=1 Tax=Pseudomonas sp. Leaf58 TaxID=1736226 RepID=UPI0006FF562C|nr:hypothetical protein [Pseudomonas sp. Leaf58]AYG47718.1 hypothetical protein DV532_25850 [Pseudomonas sp. Leaf58]KQN62718.1 hypothetical protein ASF02_11270 [Pseudomonas sp. Leaf58]
MHLTYDQLPVNALDTTAVDAQRSEALFITLSKTLIDSLARFFEGKRVLECYAGRGHLSALLQQQGINIKPTSLQMGHDQTAELGYVTEVEILSVLEAVNKYRDWMDVLLVAWPISDESLYRVLPELPAGCPIVFIGEVTDYTLQPFPFLGGCASDRFFDAVQEQPELTAQLKYPTRRQDTIKVFQYVEPIND